MLADDLPRKFRLGARAASGPPPPRALTVLSCGSKAELTMHDRERTCGRNGVPNSGTAPNRRVFRTAGTAHPRARALFAVERAGEPMAGATRTSER